MHAHGELAPSIIHKKTLARLAEEAQVLDAASLEFCRVTFSKREVKVRACVCVCVCASLPG